MTRATLNASLCFLSGAALVSQMLGAREVLALTGGNELVLGLVFGAWFFWSGIGAALAGWLRFGQGGATGGDATNPDGTGGDARATVRWCLLSGTAGWLPLLQVILLRLGSGWLETGDGRLTGIWQAVGAAGLLLAWPPLFCGACFAALAAARVPSTYPLPLPPPARGGGTVPLPPPARGGGTVPLPPPAPGRGESGVAERFSWDAIGAALAGALFSFVLAGRLSAIQSGLLFVGAGGLFRACFFWKQPLPRFTRSTWLLTLALALLAWLSGWAGRFEGSSLRWRPRFAAGQEQLIAVKESRYQRLLLAEYRGQYTVYGDGEALATYPDRESSAAEAHFVACQAPRLRRVLVAGAAPGSTVRELLRYGPECIDVVVFDSEVLALLWDKLSAEDRVDLRDPAVRLHTGDVARFLLEAPAGEYDLIWLHPPAPSSIQANRFYTAEFFRRAARALSGRGALTFTTTGAPNYLGPVMFAYLGSMRAALQAAFPVVRELPGSEERFLAAKEPGVLPSDPEEAVARFEGRKLAIPDFAPEIFFTMWEPEHEAKRAQDFDAPPASLPEANTNQRPSAMLAYLDIWNRFAGADGAEALPLPPPARGGGTLPLPPRARGGGSAPAAPQARGWPAPFLIGLALLLCAFVAKVLHRRGAFQRGRTANVQAAPPPFPSRGGEGVGGGRQSPRPVPQARYACVLLAGLAGAAGVALELCLLAVYQAACGYVYERLALVSGLYMLGERGQTAHFQRAGNGCQSPLAPQGERDSVGSILAADYAGATLGALTAGTFLIPWLGITGALFTICACAVAGLVVAVTALGGTILHRGSEARSEEGF